MITVAAVFLFLSAVALAGALTQPGFVGVECAVFSGAFLLAGLLLGGIYELRTAIRARGQDKSDD